MITSRHINDCGYNHTNHMKSKIVCKNVYFPVLLPMCILKSLFYIFVLCCSVNVGISQDADPPDNWINLSDEFQVGDMDLIEWWTVFQDDTLNLLIERAAASNYDLQLAVSRIEEARSRYRLAIGDFFPGITAQGSVMPEKANKNLTGFNTKTTIYALSAGLNWEIDVFGRIRNTAKAANANFRYSIDDRYAVSISLYAEVANAYFNLRTIQEYKKGLVFL